MANKDLIKAALKLGAAVIAIATGTTLTGKAKKDYDSGIKQTGKSQNNNK